MNSTKSCRKRHLLVAVSQEGDLKSHAVVDVPRDSGPLMKELAFRTVGAHPEMGGQPFELDLWADPPRGIAVEVHPAGAVSKNGPLTRISVPVSGFQPVAEALARRAKLEQPFQYHVLPCAKDSQAVRNWASLGEDEEISWEEVEEEYLLPRGHRGDRRGRPGWSTARPRGSAASSTSRPTVSSSRRRRRRRSARGPGSGRARSGRVPSTAWSSSRRSRSWPPPRRVGPISARRGGRVSRLLGDLGPDRILAHLHLHPREVEGKPMSPAPSSEDEHLAWDFSSQLSHLPCCFPIALFGLDPEKPDGELAVHGFDNGILSRIQLEVTV